MTPNLIQPIEDVFIYFSSKDLFTPIQIFLIISEVKQKVAMMAMQLHEHLHQDQH